MPRFLLPISAAALLLSLVPSCEKSSDDGKPQAADNLPAPSETETAIVAPPQPTIQEPDAPQSMISSMGEFGSTEPIERPDLPARGILSFPVVDRNQVLVPGEHWEQYNFPFKARRWGRYRVRLSYTLKSPSLGVQLKLGEQRLKKQLKNTSSIPAVTTIGEVLIEQAGDQFLALYTPPGVGWSTFELHEITLIPTAESETTIKPAEDGQLHLLARDAVTWSETMRYEPKPEKNCLGFWTEKDDFAEWEFEVTKPGAYQIVVHQGCGAGGGSEVAVKLAGQELEFTVEDTGGFQNWKPVTVGKIEINSEGTYRLVLQPKTKEGKAIMDIQKVVLLPVS